MPNTRPNKNIPTEQENPLFHDTWKLLKNYRDAVWNLELAVQQRSEERRVGKECGG